MREEKNHLSEMGREIRVRTNSTSISISKTTIDLLARKAQKHFAAPDPIVNRKIVRCGSSHHFMPAHDSQARISL